jgi:hypothetical protein
LALGFNNVPFLCHGRPLFVGKVAGMNVFREDHMGERQTPAPPATQDCKPEVGTTARQTKDWLSP